MKGMPGVGSIWTWTALCAETKMIVSWRLGARDAANAHAFISDLSGRLANRVQMTTDGNRVYLDAVENYSRLVLACDRDRSSRHRQHVRNSPLAAARRASVSLNWKRRRGEGWSAMPPFYQMPHERWFRDAERGPGNPGRRAGAQITACR